MTQQRERGRDVARKPRAKDLPPKEALERVALRYLDRFDSSASNLRRILSSHGRRSALHSQAGEDTLATLIEEMLERYQASGLLDDARYANHKVRSLRARGTSERGIRQKLQASGVPLPTIEAALAGTDSLEPDPELEAARAFARRRRLGTFAKVPRPHSEKDLAALARAGYSFSVARAALALDRTEDDVPSAASDDADGDSWP